jgi:hypothetical protein
MIMRFLTISLVPIDRRRKSRKKWLKNAKENKVKMLIFNCSYKYSALSDSY